MFTMWRDALGPRYMCVTVMGSLRLNVCGKYNVLGEPIVVSLCGWL